MKRTHLRRCLPLILIGLGPGCGGESGPGDGGSLDLVQAADTRAPQADGAAIDAGAPADGGTRRDGADVGVPAADGTAGEKGFGEPCQGNDQCTSGVCHGFGIGAMCTQTCTGNDSCPSGSEGKKCNKQGVCRP